MNPSGTRNHLAADLDHLEPKRSRMLSGPRDCVPLRVQQEMRAAALDLEVATQSWGIDKGDDRVLE